jgi:hypothetical protein
LGPVAASDSALFRDQRREPQAGRERRANNAHGENTRIFRRRFVVLDSVELCGGGVALRATGRQNNKTRDSQRLSMLQIHGGAGLRLQH